MKFRLVIYVSIFYLLACSKGGDSGPAPAPTPPAPIPFLIGSALVNGSAATTLLYDIPVSPEIRVRFTRPIERNSISSALSFANASAQVVTSTVDFTNGDSTVVIRASQPLQHLTRYTVKLSTAVSAKGGGTLNAPFSADFITSLDSSRKFPLISDEELLTLIQQKTFDYFWGGAHPVSGLARERNSSGDLVTSGGSGFGIMAMLAAVKRNFVTRAEALSRLQTMVTFLKDKAQTLHGAYPHWLNGASGAIIPFSANDDGADLVETSYLIQGLLSARAFFNSGTAEEIRLRNDITTIWERVEWNFFRNGTQQLYWHWSKDKGFIMNLPIKGWNECLITYVLAASSPTFPISKSVYDQGWASNGAMKNGLPFFGIRLPLGPDYGGPLFFAHYSFLGINPNGLSDAYAPYLDQNRNHTLINYTYCVNNPKKYYGYSDSCWGLTASDIPNSYAASSPTNDLGVIAPTAALSSLPYTPVQSMKALKFFYYVLGDKIFKQYGFVDAFSLKDLWFADSYLAIDQGPIVVMIENYRSQMLWDLFTGIPEVKTGMKALGFQSPYL